MSQSEHATPRPVPLLVKGVVGIFLTALGLLLTADNLDLIHSEPLLAWWPLVLVVVGGIILLEPGNRVVAGILLAAGTLLLLRNLDLLRWSISDFWPIVLIAIGIVLVFRALGAGRRRDDAVVLQPETRSWSIFSSRELVSRSEDYSGGYAWSILGGHDIDLSGASIRHTPAVLEVLAIWGGVVITVPDDWEVVAEVTPIMGGFEDKSSSSGERGQQLVVRGLALMGGIEVKSRKRGER